MGLTREEKEERQRRTAGIRSFMPADNQPYVFISYKSDDWETVLVNIVGQLQDRYGLRVYYDKNFDTDNDSWVKNLNNAIYTKKCKMILAFVSERYMESYACLMELLTSNTSTACLTHNQKPVPIIPILIGENQSIGEMISQSSAPIHVKEWGAYIELLEKFMECSRIDDKELISAVKALYDLKDGASIEIMSSVMSLFFNSSHEREWDGTDFFFDNLVKAIKNITSASGKADDDVFDESIKGKFQNEINKLPKAMPEKESKAETIKPNKAVPEKESKAEVKKLPKAVLEKDSKLEVKEEVKTSSATVVATKPLEVQEQLEESTEAKIGLEAKQFLFEFFNQSSISQKELKEMLTQEYATKYLKLGYPLLVLDRNESNKKRYYKDPVHISGKNYYVCSQWYERQREYFESWKAQKSLTVQTSPKAQTAPKNQTTQKEKNNDITIGEVRDRFASDEAFCAKIGEIRKNQLPFGGRSQMDYAMAAVLGGCNNITKPHQLNYYSYAIADKSNKKDDDKIGATFTWSSNARKAIGMEGSGRLDKELNDYFENLPAELTLKQLIESFEKAERKEFITKKNDLAIIGLQKVIEAWR